MFSQIQNKRGATIADLIVSIAIIGTLTVALGFEFQGWIAKYKVENQLKELYVDFMNTRVSAMQRNREFYAHFPTTSSLSIREDTDEDANYGDSEGDTVLPIYPKSFQYPVKWSGGTLIFKKTGIVQPSSTPLGTTLCVFTQDNPDYDCMVISQTRINIGKLRDVEGLCNASNCRQQ
jgi:Tfp pilus assembly protein FimT